MSWRHDHGIQLEPNALLDSDAAVVGSAGGPGGSGRATRFERFAAATATSAVRVRLLQLNRVCPFRAVMRTDQWAVTRGSRCRRDCGRAADFVDTTEIRGAARNRTNS